MMDKERLERLVFDFKDESAKAALEKAKERRDEGWVATVRQINQFLDELVDKIQPIRLSSPTLCPCPSCQNLYEQMLKDSSWTIVHITTEGVSNTITITPHAPQPTASTWGVVSTYEPELSPKTPKQYRKNTLDWLNGRNDQKTRKGWRQR